MLGAVVGTDDAQRSTRFKAGEHVRNALPSLPRVQLELAADPIERKRRFALVDPVQRLGVVPGAGPSGQVVKCLGDRIESQQERSELVEIGDIHAGEEFGDERPD